MRDEQDFEPNRIDKALGRRIRGLREQAGMTREKLAEKLNVTVANIGQIERGERARNVAQLGEIAQALDVTTADLEIDGLGYAGEPLSLTGAGKGGPKGSGKRD